MVVALRKSEALELTLNTSREGGTMLSCKHKNTLAVLNGGYTSEMCMLHGKGVNDAICSKCPDKVGGMSHEPVEVDFPRRLDSELALIREVCSTCPLFNTETQLCRQSVQSLLPTDISGQHPGNHCPEQKW